MKSSQAPLLRRGFVLLALLVLVALLFLGMNSKEPVSAAPPQASEELSPASVGENPPIKNREFVRPLAASAAQGCTSCHGSQGSITGVLSQCTANHHGAPGARAVAARQSVNENQAQLFVLDSTEDLQAILSEVDDWIMKAQNAELEDWIEQSAEDPLYTNLNEFQELRQLVVEELESRRGID